MSRKINGMSADKYRSAIQEQQQQFGSPTVVATGLTFVTELGHALHDVEVKRAATIKKVSLWPCRWVGGQCTGEPLMLYRSMRQMKGDQPNPHFGRFYVAFVVPVCDEHGTPIVDPETGREKTRPENFCWFNETQYVSSNCFGWTWDDNPALIRLMTKTFGPTMREEDLWPGTKQMATLWSNVLARLSTPFEVAQHEPENQSVAQSADDIPATQEISDDAIHELVSGAA